MKSYSHSRYGQHHHEMRLALESLLGSTAFTAAYATSTTQTMPNSTALIRKAKNECAPTLRCGRCENPGCPAKIGAEHLEFNSGVAFTPVHKNKLCEWRRHTALVAGIYGCR